MPRIMSLKSTNQYLQVLRKDYLKASRKEKGKLLDEAGKRTGLERKYLIKKLKPKSNLDKKTEIPISVANWTNRS